MARSAAYTDKAYCTSPYVQHKSIGPALTQPERVFIGGPYNDNNLMAFLWPPCYRRRLWAYAVPEHGDFVYRLEAIQGIVIY